MAVALVTLLSTSLAAPSLAATGHKKLSLSKVVIDEAINASAAPLLVALHQGYFKKLGLDVSILPSNFNSATAAIFISGAAQFVIEAAVGELAPVSQGAPLRSIAQLGSGSANEIAINTSAATAHNIPLTGTTAAGALKQFLALKNSHLLIGISNTASSAYILLSAWAKLHNLTIGPNGDFNVLTTGSPAAEQAAILSGTVDGVAGVAPTTVEPNVMVIKLSITPPFSSAPAQYLSTSPTMIQKHPDTVQAFLDGITQALSFIYTNPVQSEKAFAAGLATVGITSPEEAQYLFADNAGNDHGPFPYKNSYAAMESIQRLTGTPLDIPYSSWVATKFVNKALKDYPNLQFRPFAKT